MELLLFVGAFVALDVVAYFFGYDSREDRILSHHDRALDAARRGDLNLYRSELAELERDLAKSVGSWRGY